MGHIMRCLALAQGLHKRGINSRFLIKQLNLEVGKIIQQHEYEVEEMPPVLPVEEEAERTLQMISACDDAILFLDVCHNRALFDPIRLNSYHEMVSRRAFTVTIAGATILDVQADIILDPIVRPEAELVKLTKGQKLLQGPDYFVFRNEFLKVLQGERSIPSIAQKILVLISGGDPDEFTLKALQAVTSHANEEMEVRVVVGPCFSKSLVAGVEECLRSLKIKRSLLRHDSNMAEALLWADLALIGDGLVKYESSLLGTPAIILGRNIEKEVILNKAFVAYGSGVYIENVISLSDEKLREKIQSVRFDLPHRKNMSAAGRRLVDGKGFDRIVQSIDMRSVC